MRKPIVNILQPAGPGPGRQDADSPAPTPAPARPAETGGPPGPEPTRYGDWEKGGRCIDF